MVLGGIGVGDLFSQRDLHIKHLIHRDLIGTFNNRYVFF
jgi:hypothetical protein